MKISIGADHRGFVHKEFIKQNISLVEWIDVGTYNQERTDYPVFVDKVINLIIMHKADVGILICGSGGGMAIAANRYKNIYAVVAWDIQSAQRCKQDDNANILVLPADFISLEESVEIIHEWLGRKFKGGRYAERLAMIDE